MCAQGRSGLEPFTCPAYSVRFHLVTSCMWQVLNGALEGRS